MTTEPQAALWYYRHFDVRVDTYATEADAAAMAYVIEDEGSGSIVGVQLEDGTLHRRDEWPALAEYKQRETWRQSAADPLPPTRKVLLPWPDKTGAYTAAYIGGDEPSWIGYNPEEDE